MGEIIQKWIYQQLALTVSLIPEDFAKFCCDGYLIAEILHSYAIIDHKQLNLIVPSQDPLIIANNYQNIILWLKWINITPDKDCIQEIINGKGSSALKLLYHLYLVLSDNKFIINKAVESVIIDFVADFTHETETKISKPKINQKYLFDNFFTLNQHVLNWRKIQYETLLKCCKDRRQQHQIYLQEKYGPYYLEKFKIKEYPKEFEENIIPRDDTVVDCSYKELLEELRKAEELDALVPYEDKAKTALKTFRKKRREKEKEDAFRDHLHKLLLLEIWELIIQKQNIEFEENLCKKQHNLSCFEQESVHKFLEAKTKNVQNLEKLQEEYKISSNKADSEFVNKLLNEQNKENEDVKNYYADRKKLLVLHRKLYNKKLLEKKKVHATFCKDVVNDIINLALKYAEYTEAFHKNPSWLDKHKWKELFIKGQQLLEQDLEELERDECEEEEEKDSSLDSDIEELYNLEIQDDENYYSRLFEEYNNFMYPYDIEQRPDLQNLVESMNLGMNVLGHIIHKLMLACHPKPYIPAPVGLPDVSVAVCINGIKDMTILPTLNTLLSERGIKLLQIDDGVKYCLDAYKKETTMEYEEPVVEAAENAQKKKKESKSKKGKKEKKEKKSTGKKSDKKEKDKKSTGKKSDKKEKDKKSSGKKKSEKKSKTGKGKGSSLKGEPKFCDEENQTPYIYPCEEIVLSYTAELGATADDILKSGKSNKFFKYLIEIKFSGEKINNRFLIGMFIEYLKSLKNINGWVIVNFPETIEEAALLEEALTGRPVPYISERLASCPSIDDFSSHKPLNILIEDDENAKYRKSYLFKDPSPPPPENYYDSYLTAFIDLKPSQEEQPKTKYIVVENVIEEEIDYLESFYTDQGCYYVLNYEKMGFPVIKQLGKLILGEFRLPPKTSVELFGETVNLLQTATAPEASNKRKGKKEKKKKEKKKGKKKEEKTKEKKKEKSKESKGSKKSKSTGKSSSKKGKKSKKSKGSEEEDDIIIIKAEKETQIPEIVEKIEEVIEEVPQPKAGELGWQYVSVNPPHSVQLALDVLWRTIEKDYCEFYKEIFTNITFTTNVHVPFINLIEKCMKEYVCRPDNKQIYVTEFQRLYNEIDDEFRHDVRIKDELHCRIAEFREKMWQIADIRMRETEEERRRLVEEDWLLRLACEMINLRNWCMQLEIDRTMDSLMLISDYYVGIITKSPCQVRFLEKYVLPTVNMSEKFADMQMFLQSRLLHANRHCHNSSHDEVLYLIEEIYEKSSNCLEEYRNYALSMLENMKEVFQPITSSKCTNKLKLVTRDDKQYLEYFEPDQEVKAQSAEIMEEWACAIKGEYSRGRLRLELLLNVSVSEWKSIFSFFLNKLSLLYQDLTDYYKKELESINKLCEVFARATDAEMKLEPRLILEGEKFYIQPNVILFDEFLPTTEIPIKESTDGYLFTLDQLNKLVKIFMDMAPTGNITKQNFIYLLQDMILHDSEELAEPSFVPQFWRNLNSSQTEKLCDCIFGTGSELVRWKDFIIYNLYLPFPTEKQLLYIRQNFKDLDPNETENVTESEYNSVEFWFERAYIIENESDKIWINSIKQLLAGLFKVDKDVVNYTDLLLAFCKDDTSVKGFAKALELSIGKCICWDVDRGTEFVNGVLKQKREEEEALLLQIQEHENNIAMVGEVLAETVDNTVHLCDSIVIEDYFSDKASTATEKLNITEQLKVEETENESVKADSILTEFSNVPIGFECNPFLDRACFVPYNIIINVLAIFLTDLKHYNSIRREQLKVLYEKCKRNDFNDRVLIHEFLNNEFFEKIFQNINCFTVQYPKKIIHDSLMV